MQEFEDEEAANKELSRLRRLLTPGAQKKLLEFLQSPFAKEGVIPDVPNDPSRRPKPTKYQKAKAPNPENGKRDRKILETRQTTNLSWAQIGRLFAISREAARKAAERAEKRESDSE